MQHPGAWAHGRNHFAEEAFKAAAAAAAFEIQVVRCGVELHPDYQCTDVGVPATTALNLAGKMPVQSLDGTA